MRAEGECFHDLQWAGEPGDHLAPTPEGITTPFESATSSRSPKATPGQQGTTNPTQVSLVGMTKGEKAGEMNRRKEERKQVSGAESADSLSQWPTTPS